MKQMQTFSDSRLNEICVYCGGYPDTRDHVPSKIILDEPYPENLPVVPACDSCNQGFSKDEEYFACLIECTLRGTTDPEKLERKRISDILTRKVALRKKLEQAHTVVNGQTGFELEIDRVKNVLLKLAKGHAIYENSEIQIEEEEEPFIGFKPVALMTEDEQATFFSSDGNNGFFPEVGSRAFMRSIMGSEDAVNNWITVQPGKYQYSVSSNSLVVKILIWDYLACEIAWD